MKKLITVIFCVVLIYVITIFVVRPTLNDNLDNLTAAQKEQAAKMEKERVIQIIEQLKIATNGDLVVLKSGRIYKVVRRFEDNTRLKDVALCGVDNYYDFNFAHQIIQVIPKRSHEEWRRAALKVLTE